MAAIQPEVVTVFIQSEDLRGKAESEEPFPLHHDGLVRA